MNYLQLKLAALLTASLVLSGLTPPEPTLAIYQLQGESHLSPYQEQRVQTQGVVTAVSAQGFFLQDAKGDRNPLTSDAIFVLPPGTGPSPLKPGMLLAVRGRVHEVPVADSVTGLTRTTLQAEQVRLLKSRVALPAPVILGGPQGRPIPKRQISSHQGNVNSKTGLKPDEGLDFYESLESMRVQISRPRLVAPGSPYGELYLVADAGREALPPLNSRHSLLLDLENNDYNPEILVLKNPQHPDVQVHNSPAFNSEAYRKGDLFQSDIEGILDFNLSTRPGFFVGGYFIYPSTALPDVESAGLQPQQTRLVSGPKQLTLANYNVENLSPDNPAHNPDKMQKLGEHIVRALKSPDILMLQEVGDNDGPQKSEVVAADKTLQALIDAVRAAGGPPYAFLDIPPVPNAEGGLPGANIRVAYLYQPERVSLLERPAGDSTRSVGIDAAGHLTFNPGRIATEHPAFAHTRKSLAVEFLFAGHSIVCINNHLSSKRGDGSIWSAHQPPKDTSTQVRLAQTQVLHNFAQELLQKNPQAKIVLAGDFNEFYAAEPLQRLKGDILHNLIEDLPFENRYTYIFKGSSQTLDQFFVSRPLYEAWKPEVEIVHLNADFSEADGAESDHDPVVARFTLP